MLGKFRKNLTAQGSIIYILITECVVYNLAIAHAHVWNCTHANSQPANLALELLQSINPFLFISVNKYKQLSIIQYKELNYYRFIRLPISVKITEHETTALRTVSDIFYHPNLQYFTVLLWNNFKKLQLNLIFMILLT